MTKGKFRESEFWIWAGVILGVAAMVAILSALAGCSAPRTLAAGLDTDDSPRPIPGIIREIHGPTPCEAEVNPALRWVSGLPKPGSKVRLVGVTRHGPNPPDELMVLVASFDPDRFLFDGDYYGATGCWLLVRPEIAFVVPSTPRNHRLQVWGGSGAMWVNFWPNASDVGLTLRVQMIVLSPGINDLGVVGSNAVEVVVGQ